MCRRKNFDGWGRKARMTLYQHVCVTSKLRVNPPYLRSTLNVTVGEPQANSRPTVGERKGHCGVMSKDQRRLPAENLVRPWRNPSDTLVKPVRFRETRRLRCLLPVNACSHQVSKKAGVFQHPGCDFLQPLQITTGADRSLPVPAFQLLVFLLHRIVARDAVRAHVIERQSDPPADR
jgi:hypothetical protein